MLSSIRGPTIKVPSLCRSIYKGNADRLTARGWANAGRGPVFATDDNKGFPKQRILAQKTNRKVNFVPKFIKKSSTAWIFKGRYTNSVLQRMAKNRNKHWALTHEEYNAIRNADLRRPHRERTLSFKDLITQLRKEEIMKTKINYPRQIPDFKAGDRIAVTQYVELGQESKVETIRGMCIARKQAMNESWFAILNHRDDTTYEMKIPLWSPFIKSIDIIEKGNIKRRKAYYLRDRLPEEFQT